MLWGFCKSSVIISLFQGRLTLYHLKTSWPESLDFLEALATFSKPLTPCSLFILSKDASPVSSGLALSLIFLSFLTLISISFETYSIWVFLVSISWSAAYVLCLSFLREKRPSFSPI